MQTCTIVAALIGAAAADSFVWNGNQFGFNTPASWVGISGNGAGASVSPKGPVFPTTTLFGAGSGVTGPQIVSVMTSGISDVGTRLSIMNGAKINFANGGKIEFNNPANSRPTTATVATYVAATTGFLRAQTNREGAEHAAGSDFNCPLNWQVNGAATASIPSGSDTAVINAGDFYVSTFGARATAGGLTLGSTTVSDASVLCSNNGAHVVPASGASGPSTFTTGGALGCTAFQFSGTAESSCGNLVTSSVAATAEGTSITLYTCQDGSTTCAHGGVALATTGNSASRPTVTTTSGADGATVYTIEGASETVTVSTDGTATVAASGGDGSSGGGGGGGGSGLMLYAVAAAAVVIIIIAIMVFRKKSKEAKAKKPDNSKATMGFANPVYDSDVANPTYDGGENYVDLPEKEAGDAGYLDVDNVDEEAAYGVADDQDMGEDEDENY